MGSAKPGARRRSSAARSTYGRNDRTCVVGLNERTARVARMSLRKPASASTRRAAARARIAVATRCSSITYCESSTSCRSRCARFIVVCQAYRQPRSPPFVHGAGLDERTNGRPRSGRALTGGAGPVYGGDPPSGRDDEPTAVAARRLRVVDGRADRRAGKRRRADRGRRDRGGGRAPGGGGRRAARRLRARRHARLRRHAPPHLAGAVSRRMRRLDAGGLLSRHPHGDLAELLGARTSTPATCSARWRRWKLA